MLSTVVPRAENFGDLITADQTKLSEGSESRNNHRYAVVVQDLATQWLQSYPCKTKTSQATQKSQMKFLEPTRKPKVIYTDNSLAFGKSCEELSWNHCTSTPHRSETNGIAKRAVRRVKEGTSAELTQSGLDENRWADSMECYLSAKRHRSFIWWEDTIWKAFRNAFNGPVIPFGAIVECHPISAKDTSRLHQFGPKVLPGIFIGFVLYAERIWKGDIPIADTEELEKMDATELHARRLNAKEVLTPMKGDNFMFPVADGTVEVSGGDQRLRPSTLIQDRREQGEEQGVLRGESDGLSSPIPLQDVSTRDDAEAKNDFWSITGDFIYRHHVEPRVKLYVPRKESFLIPLQFFDVTRNTNTSLDAQLEKKYCWLLERGWNQMHGRASQESFYWTKGLLTDIHGLVWDLRGNKRPQDPTMYGQICGSICLRQRSAKQSKSGSSRNQSSIMPDNCVVSSSLNQMMMNLNIPWETLVESWKFRCQ